MIAVIFEVWPADGQMQHYLDLAASIRGELDRIDGFISIERFQSLAELGKLVSLSFWRDEAAVRQWRNLPAHRATQAKGRGGVLARLSAARRGRGARLWHGRTRGSAGRQPRRA